jgi:hypothetical protein
MNEQDRKVVLAGIQGRQVHAFSPVIFGNPETIDEMSALRARQGNYVALLHSFCSTLLPPTRAAQSASYVFARPSTSVLGCLACDRMEPALTWTVRA